MFSAVIRKVSLVFLAILICASFAYSQKVRLRSQFTPNCPTSAGNENLKFSDLFGDGNVAVLGSYACRGAFIFDISNPDAPVLASWYNPVRAGTTSTNEQFLEAVVVGNRAYFGSGNGGGVYIVDVSNPYSPVLLGTVNATNANAFSSIHEMVVFNQNGATYLIENFNACCSSTKILKVINITNPASPVFVRDINPTEAVWVHAMVVKGNRMFTSGWGNSANRGRTEIYDISNIATQAPALLGFISDQTTITAGNNMHSAWPSEDGNFLYSCRETSTGSGDVRVYNISNPGSPLLVNRIGMNDLGLNAVTPHNPVVAGNYLYVAWYQAGIQVFDISVPSSPVRVGQYDTFQPTFVQPAEDAVEQKKGSRSSSSKLIADEPWDMICGAERLQNSLPTTYDGNWSVYPFLGQNKVLAGDLKYGLLILDASQVSVPLKNRAADFDGDRRTDLSMMRPESGSWQIESSSSGATIPVRLRLGQAGDQLVAGDYDGDGRSDIGVYRPGTNQWIVPKMRSKGSREYLINGVYGLSGDVPIPGDYDADGKTDVGLYRPSNVTFYIWQSTLGFKTVTFGGAFGDKAVTGDYDGDGKTDLALYRPTTGGWIIQQSSSSILLNFTLGQSGDRPIEGDFNGNGITDIGVFRPSSGEWITRDPVTGQQTTFVFGASEDAAMPADFDGDGRWDYSVYRRSTSEWLRVNSSDGSTVVRVFGQSGDTPVPLSVQPF